MKTTMEMCNQTGSSSKPVKRKQISGFTLIELLIVIVIVAIGVALAVPTFRSITEKRQLTSAAESVAAFMNLAQSTAVKYDQDVIVNMQRTDFDTWCVGAILGATACDCMENDTTAADFCDINGVPRRTQHADVISNSGYQLLQSIQVNSTASANSNVTFDPVRGTLLNLETISFQMHTNTGSGINKDYQLNVNLLPTGNVSICTATGRKSLLKMYPTCS
jgi:type IV fimbrial biogenesis protein FimT